MASLGALSPLSRATSPTLLASHPITPHRCARAEVERCAERTEVERVRREWRESEGEQLGGAVKVSCEGEQLEALLPGPVTVLLARRADAPLTAALNPGVATIGVRVPDSPFVRALARAHGGPLALTSANASGEPAALEVGEAAAVAPAAAVVVDGGRVGGGGNGRAGSTVVDLSAAGAGVFTVLREGDGADGVREALSGAGLKESV